jgi:hypothetical protein
MRSAPGDRVKRNYGLRVKSYEKNKGAVVARK